MLASLGPIARPAVARLRRWTAVLVHPRPTRAWFATVLAAVTVIGILYFFAAVTAEELLRPLYDPVQRTISELAVGPFGFLQTSAFVALGLSLLALQHALYRRLRHTIASRVALALLGLCGLLSFAAAIFPTDLKGAVVTAAGTVHEVVASVGYAGLIVAMILLSLHFRRDERWRAFARPSSSLAVLGVCTSIVMGATSQTDVSGLSQRLMVVPLLSWVVWTAVHARATHTEPVPASAAPETIDDDRERSTCA
ncbi:MAG TPA: DUF998 domain-containing protein [Thermoleophilia bacterium]|nr:DUF998 domain-containing protein [Thermoleophilia bacterium]